ncbi:thiolase family protein [Rhodococcus sp. 1R11]|uniref:thiolase family protein n=1 Tax=Rhodococcus sp. 1R11 TaxID=2559614 RepID=UPI00107280ED|nr:thiolase family protein [Rhodococcus sp. 1R11]TFI44844.1 thiolase family protein [Rhodococcus sp. 1R11]
MNSRVWIAGVGMTPFGIHPNRSNHDLARLAISDAIRDAGVSANIGMIDVAFYASAAHGFLEGQATISGQIALRGMGIGTIPVHNVENACATGASAFNLAVTHVRAGEADVALAVGAEKMHIGDPQKTMSLFDAGFDVTDRASLERTMVELGGDLDEPDLGHRSIFMDIYAAMARNHMRIYGSTPEQIAAVSAKNHAHAVDNTRAHYRRALSVEDVLAARRLSHPLTVPMCAPVTDGGAAVIVCSDAGLARLHTEYPIEVLATVVGTGTDRDTTTFDGHLAQHVATRAYDKAGIGPDQVDVAEVHDATAFAEVLQSEMLGLVPPGEGGAAAERGDTSIGGRIPINPSGGLESKGHPLGATGLGQVFELTDQLRGRAGRRQVDGARIALAENGGGFHRGEEAVTSVIILKGT